MDAIEELARALARLPGIGPRQGKRFVYYLLAAPAQERKKLADCISALDASVQQCPDCLRFYTGRSAALCQYCRDPERDDAQLMLVEKDQDISALERAGTYKGRYFVLGGVLTLTGKGAIREKELIARVLRQAPKHCEIVLALGATSEGEHTADHIRSLLAPYRDTVTISILGRGLATGSELEYSDAETLRAALSNRKET